MFGNTKLTVWAPVPESERDLQLQSHILENYRDNHWDVGVFRERMVTSGFGELEYNRMVKAMAADDYLVQQNLRLKNWSEFRLSRQGKAYLKYLLERGVPHVVQPVTPQLLPAVQPAASESAVESRLSWRTFWRRDIAIITGIIGTIATVAIAVSRCGVF